MFYLLITHNIKINKIHGTPLLRINISRQRWLLNHRQQHLLMKHSRNICLWINISFLLRISTSEKALDSMITS